MMSVFLRLGAAIQLQRKAILIIVVLAVVIYVGVQTNHAHAQRVLTALSSPSQSIRDSEVLSLLQSGNLVDALASTEDPNQDATSPQNVRSVQIRQNAADSVDRLIAGGKVADQPAMDALFLLRKDADSGVQAKATAGLVALGTSHPSNLSKIAARLQDGDPDIRNAASDALGQIGGDKTAKLIDPLLKDPTAQDAVQSAMEKIGSPSVPYLIAHLADPDLAFRQRVVTMLGQIASPQSILPLENVAASNVPSMRLPALVALSDTVLTNYDTYQKAQSAVRTLSADPKTLTADLQTAKQAASAAANAFAQTRPAEPPLIAALQSGTDDSEARIQAALALGRLDSPADVATLVGALGDYDSRVRQAALSGVQSTGAPAAGLLTAALDQGPPVARAAAAEALGVIGTPAALATLQARLADKTTPPDLRRSTLMGLGQNGSPSVIPLLITALGDPDGTVTATASDALLNPSLEQSAIPALVATFSQPAPRPFNGSQTLARMGDLPTEALKTAATSPDPQTQTWAAVTLGQSYSSDPTIAAALQPLTHSSNAGVQYAATQALTHLAGA